MKLLFVVVIAILTTVALSERPGLTLEPMNWSSITYPPNGFTVMTTRKDLLVYYDTSAVTDFRAKRGVPSPSPPPVMTIRRRSAEGVYEFVANVTITTDTPVPSTNGKWISLYSYEGTMLFSVNNNNTLSEYSYLNTYGGYFLSDDTFVGYDPVSPLNDGNYTFRSYQYEPSNNTWLNIPGTEVVVTTFASFSYDSATYRVTNTHLVFVDSTNSSDISVQIYSRQADKSWKFVESVPINSTYGIQGVNMNYNGVDTLVASVYNLYLTESDTYGVVLVYTKVNGQWSEQILTTVSVGYRPQGNLGGGIEFVDANTLLVTAATEGDSGKGVPSGVGKVLVMTRNDQGLWEPSFDFINPINTGVWGTALGVNDYDIIVPNLVYVSSSPPNLTFFTLPACFFLPINVTCKDQQVSDCTQLDTSSLFTVNNAQCGAVSATVNGLSLVNNKALQAQFSFTKQSTGQVASCNATVTCPVPVVTQPPSSTKVSGASALQLGVVAVFSLAIAFV